MGCIVLLLAFVMASSKSTDPVSDQCPNVETLQSDIIHIHSELLQELTDTHRNAFDIKSHWEWTLDWNGKTTELATQIVYMNDKLIGHMHLRLPCTTQTGNFYDGKYYGRDCLHQLLTPY